MNGITPTPRHGLSRVAWTLGGLAGLALLPASPDAAPAGACSCGEPRAIEYRILYQHKDGAWLVPTLRAVRSARQWEAAMDAWQARHEVVGREPAPAVDWSREAVIVVSLGRQVRQCGISVRGCHRSAEVTVLDLHMDIGDGRWDPIGTVEHPCAVVAVARADLKEIALRCDATIDGLPAGQDRRGEVSSDRNHPDAARVATAAGAEATSWGRVKALYRGSAADGSGR